AEVKRLSAIQRFFAKALFGGGFMSVANWDDAVRHLERAVAIAPTHIYHRLELAEVYTDLGRYSKAREQLQIIPTLPNVDVLDPHTELLGLEVDPRLERDHHAGLERPAEADVVDVHPDRMAEAVVEVFAVIAGLLTTQRARVRAHVCPRDAVQLPDRDARAHGVERRLLRTQHQIVDRLLPRREAAVDRERARHVGGVLAPFRRGIDQDQIAVLGAAAVDVVVQRRGVGAAAHDRGISDAVGAV